MRFQSENPGFAFLRSRVDSGRGLFGNLHVQSIILCEYATIIIRLAPRAGKMELSCPLGIRVIRNIYHVMVFYPV